MYEIAHTMIELENEKLGYDGASILFNYGDEQIIKHVHMHILHHSHAKHEKTIDIDFHGNRDFYNYNKGICNIKSLSKNYVCYFGGRW